MRPISVKLGPLAGALATAVCASQAPPAPPAVLNLNGTAVVGGVAVLDAPRTLAFVSTGNNSNTTFTIYGTDVAGMPISESFVGANIGTVNSTLVYKTVTQISSSAASAAGLTVGTNSTAYSAWVRFDDYSDTAVTIQTSLSGAATYTIQETLDDPNSPTNPVPIPNVNWVNSSDTNAVNATTPIVSFFAYKPAFARMIATAGSGTVTANFTQAGGGSY